jgi:hypothetical protein
LTRRLNLQHSCAVDGMVAGERVKVAKAKLAKT